MEAELRKRGLTPVADNDGDGFESFHVKDPDGFDVQISNGNGLAKLADGHRQPRSCRSPLRSSRPAGKRCGSITLSFSVTNYKESASFYMNLLGWQPTYDEGSQHELLIGDIGNIIIRGGNPSIAGVRQGAGARRASAKRGSITSRSASRRGTPTA